MPIYKDEAMNTWYAKFYYTDYTGKRKQKMKRGFELKRDAKQYEAEFIAKYKYDDKTIFSFLASDYIEENTPRRRSTTMRTYTSALNIYILPYFGQIPIGNITEKAYIDWQNIMLKKDLSDIYTHKIDTVFRTVYKFALKRCAIRENPIEGFEKIGKGNVHSLNFWTLEEYKVFMPHIVDPAICTAFQILYYTGIRLGELLALTVADIDLKNQILHIDKSLQRIKCEDVITPPKTEKGRRNIALPAFLCIELENYMKKLYAYEGQARLFTFSKQSLYYPMKKYSEIANLKKIRVHDLRHSHVAILIEQGISPLVIAERLGHEDIKITLGTYGHLYPNKQREVADLLEKLQF